MLFTYRLVRLLGVSGDNVNVYSQLGIICNNESDLRLLADRLKDGQINDLYVTHGATPDAACPLSAYITDTPTSIVSTPK
jgi:hypothetical protein